MTEAQIEALKLQLTPLNAAERASTLEACTMRELRSFAKSLGMKGYSKLKEAELIAEIATTFKASETPPEPAPIEPGNEPGNEPGGGAESSAETSTTPSTDEGKVPAMVRIKHKCRRRIEGNRSVLLLKGDDFRDHMARVLFAECPDDVEVIEWVE